MSHEIYYILKSIGTIVFAVSGALSAGRHRFDLAGVVVVACVVTVGGGTIRDLVLGTTPVFWVQQPHYLVLAVCSALVIFILGRWWEPPYRLFLLMDALGLGTFAAVGAQKTLAAGFHPGIAVLMGVITGVGGGFLRDVICGDTPLILQKEIYATAALAGSIVLVALQCAGVSGAVAVPSCLVVVIGLRLAAIHWDLKLPVFRGRR